MTLWERFRRCFMDGDKASQKAYFRFQRATEHHRQKLVHEAEQHTHGAEPLEQWLYARIGEQIQAGGLVADEKTMDELQRSNQILEQRRQQIDAGTYVAPPSLAEALKQRLGE